MWDGRAHVPASNLSSDGARQAIAGTVAPQSECCLD
jgi:hypothetical protein